MTTNSNVSPLAKGFANLEKGKALQAQSKVDITAALLTMLKDNPRFEFEYDGDTFPFALADYRKGFKLDGAQLKGVQMLKFTAIAVVHGIEPNSANQSVFVKCLDCAIAIQDGMGKIAKGADGKAAFHVPIALAKGINVGTADKLTETGKQLAGAVNFGRKAPLSGSALIDAIGKELVECNGSKYFAGGKVPTMSAAMDTLQTQAENAKLIPMRAKRDRDRGSDIDATRKAIATLSNTFITIERSDESPIAFTERDEAALREVAQHIAAYFAK